jgi:tetratricopeptide (TPR) repeat protein
MLIRQYVDAHPSAAMEVVNFLARQHRVDDAVDTLEKNWKATDPVSLHQSCMLITDAGRGPKEILDRVVSLLTEAKEHFHDDPTIMLVLGDLKMGQGRFQDAEDIYREILKNNPGHTVTMNNLTVLLTLSRKNLPEALETIEKAIKIAGPLSQMLDTRACVYIAMGKSDKALADMKDVLADGRRAETLFHYAQALDSAGQENAAAVAMQEALQKGLSEKMLMTPELPTFKRLKDKANALAPIKKGNKKTPKK